MANTKVASIAVRFAEAKVHPHAWHCERISLRRLDGLVPRGTHINVAKFDVQGFEYKALRGLTGVMDSARGGGGIDYVYVEADFSMMAEAGDRFIC